MLSEIADFEHRCKEKQILINSSFKTELWVLSFLIILSFY